MFQRIRRAFGKSASAQAAPAAPVPAHVPTHHAAPFEWAQRHGLAFEGSAQGASFAVSGEVMGKPWRLQRARSSRPFIHGEELRARAELGLSPEVAVMVINRALKEALERQAYARFTDSLQTTVDSGTHEELRWLSMFEELGWDGAPDAFWARYAVVGDSLPHARAWLDEAMCGLLLGWPQNGPDAQTPFTLMLVRGKAYLRMEYAPADLPTLAYATNVFVTACESALGGLAQPGA